MELIILIVIGVILFIASFEINNPSTRGRMGENEVAKILSKLPISEYSVLNDIYIQDKYGSTQIDHIVISLYGIFVIETKNYSGWILGGEKSEQWIKNMYGKKYYFYNPIKQNDGHISTLCRILKLPKEDFISLIVFSPKANIKVLTSKYVIHFNEILPVISSFTSKLFSVSKVDNLTNQLLSLQPSNEYKENHIEYVKDKKEFLQDALSQGICPRCGHELKIREGKYGAFIGCSNYPKCRYTHKL